MPRNTKSPQAAVMSPQTSPPAFGCVKGVNLQLGGVWAHMRNQTEGQVTQIVELEAQVESLNEELRNRAIVLDAYKEKVRDADSLHERRRGEFARLMDRNKEVSCPSRACFEEIPSRTRVALLRYYGNVQGRALH
eukprot:1029816-Prorocentrum_minimum.AAC.3